MDSVRRQLFPPEDQQLGQKTKKQLRRNTAVLTQPQQQSKIQKSSRMTTKNRTKTKVDLQPREDDNNNNNTNASKKNKPVTKKFKTKTSRVLYKPAVQITFTHVAATTPKKPRKKSSRRRSMCLFYQKSKGLPICHGTLRRVIKAALKRELLVHSHLQQLLNINFCFSHDAIEMIHRAHAIYMEKLLFDVAEQTRCAGRKFPRPVYLDLAFNHLSSYMGPKHIAVTAPSTLFSPTSAKSNTQAITNNSQTEDLLATQV